MFRQTETKYKKIKMGLGNGSIYDFGCYLVSLCNALNLNGYSFTPESLNKFLIDKNLWIGEFKNYIDVNNLAKALPDIFSSFTKVEPFTDKQLKDYISKGFIVAKVDAKAIGGTGTHFVLVTKYDGKVATIFYPWFGDEQLVTQRYSKYGNLLGLRVFGIKKFSKPKEDSMTNLIDLKADINSAIEAELGLKEYKWYNKNWSFFDMVRSFDEYYKKAEKSLLENESNFKKISAEAKKLQDSLIKFESVAKQLENEKAELQKEVERLSKKKDASLESLKEVGRISWSGLVSIILTEGVLQNVVVYLSGSRLDVGLQMSIVSSLTLFLTGLDKYLHTRSKEYNEAIVKGITPIKIWEMFKK